jgi:anaphase-promoting complex subunit 1
MGEKALVIPSVPFQQLSSLFGSGQLRDSTPAPLWLRPTVVDTRLVLEKTVRNLVAAAAGRGTGDDTVRDRLWQLRLLFAWVDYSSEDPEPTSGYQKSARLGDVGDVGDVRDARDVGRNSAGMWLRKDIIEEARWKIWGVQVGDGDGWSC